MPSEDLPGLLDNLERAITRILAVPAKGTLESLSDSAEQLLAATRSLNDALPEPLKQGPFRSLQRHVRFIELYRGRDDLRMTRGNIAALRGDMIRLRATCAPAISSKYEGLAITIEALGPSPGKERLREACVTFSANAFPSAIVAAVVSLEGFFRALYLDKLGTASDELDFYHVISELEDKGVLVGGEAPLLHIARLYRNAAAHPSPGSIKREDAKMVIEFSFSKQMGGFR
jgi:Domain of unknown function (DUF4145)